MKKAITFRVETMPLSMNNAYYTGGTGKRHLSADAKAYKEFVGYTAKPYFDEPFKGLIKVSYRFGFPSKIRRDVDNFIKIFQDSISGIAWDDDSQIQKLVAEKVPAISPYIECTVSSL